jgi:pSer/pThr/pTyr-binding forkhead associated (FHA) protein
MARAVLSVREGPDEGNTVMLSEGVTVIGRGADNGIVVDEPGVSRQHASIRGDANGFWVVDLGSRNGTFVNDTPVGESPHRLRNWDRIQLGGTSVHWVFMESEETMEMPRIEGT